MALWFQILVSSYLHATMACTKIKQMKLSDSITYSNCEQANNYLLKAVTSMYKWVLKKLISIENTTWKPFILRYVCDIRNTIDKVSWWGTDRTATTILSDVKKMFLFLEIAVVRKKHHGLLTCNYGFQEDKTTNCLIQ